MNVPAVPSGATNGSGANGLDIDRLVAGFVHVLRKGGMSVTVSQSTLFRAALNVVGLSRGIDVYWAGRSTLVLKQDHIPMYDAMFLAFFHHNTSGFSMRFDDVAEVIDQMASDDGGDGGDGGVDGVDNIDVVVSEISKNVSAEEKIYSLLWWIFDFSCGPLF